MDTSLLKGKYCMNALLLEQLLINILECLLKHLILIEISNNIDVYFRKET